VQAEHIANALPRSKKGLQMTTARTLAYSLLVVPALLSAQAPDERVLYYPKPLAKTRWQTPMQPITRLADVKAKHDGEAGWRELVIHDENSRAFLVQEPPGTRHQQRLYPDSAAWWAILDGRVRFEVEMPDRRFEVVEATKGSYVFVPERMLHAYDVIGNQAAITFEVTLASATPLYPDRPAHAPPGIEYIPVRLSTGPNPLDVPDPNGKPWPIHFNVYELANQNQGKKSWTQEAIRKNRSRGNLICGYPGSDQPVGPNNRGHFHSDFAEFWVVMLGELRWTFDGDVANSIVATQGDIVYAPPKTWHAPQFWGEQGLNCRLTSSTYPSANHLYDPAQ
jgi:mannose-6-phosphate isomerase-like protein (cupin superfamily)